MKAKRFILSALAGVMVIGGSISAYANQNDDVMKMVKVKPMNIMKSVELNQEEKAELEKMKEMTPEQLQEYIKENKPRVVPAFKCIPAKNIDGKLENIKAIELSEVEKVELEKIKEMTYEEMQEYIKVNKPKFVPKMKSIKVVKPVISGEEQEDIIKSKDM
ncbi:hypothetical protein [Tepidibacter hydrothermalis]|uniref:Uncharacterized protein n=1 Tax=Tepidibacter hydrothermalis TaxID=3036126 RepID=A0ABY8EEB3_9FIRM|nr:hypothetical protein [Tepidibacter hydrothermalis]WFD11116.1 hypothetical protein P4S50_03305 [Tepidibacter hydrothermalis]